MCRLIIVLKGGPESGWYSPPKGTHSGEKHRAVGSGRVVLKKKPGRVMYEDYITSETSAYDEAVLIATMESAGITSNDLEGLVSITTAPSKVTYLGRTISGSYDMAEKVIHAHSGSVHSRTIIHEIGHHVSTRNLGYMIPLSGKVFGIKVEVLEDTLKRFRKTHWKSELAASGLRPYSFTDVKEFLADSFMVMRMGTPSQQRSLESVASGMGIDLRAALK